MNVKIISWLSAVSLLAVAGKKIFYFWTQRIFSLNPHDQLDYISYCHSADDMLNIPGGNMLMGTSAADGRDGESPTKEVELQPFKIDKYPVTNADFR